MVGLVVDDSGVNSVSPASLHDLQKLAGSSKLIRHPTHIQALGLAGEYHSGTSSMTVPGHAASRRKVPLKQSRVEKGTCSVPAHRTQTRCEPLSGALPYNRVGNSCSYSSNMPAIARRTGLPLCQPPKASTSAQRLVL